MRREEIRAVRRHVAADLEDELVAVAQTDRTRVAGDGSAVAPRLDTAAEREEARTGEPLSPRAEEAAERRAARVVDDTGRIGRPAADARRDQDDTAVREELEMDAVRRDRGLAARVQGGRVIPRPHADRRRYRHLTAIVAVLALAGCGGGAGVPTVGAAQTYSLREHVDGTSVRLQIVQPDGAPLTRFRHGPGPHTGVHVILVRRDLATLLHLHPPVRPGGRFVVDDASLPPGDYRLVVDAYPAAGPLPNFQLFGTLSTGSYTPQLLPPLRTTETVDGYRFTLQGAPRLRAVEPAALSITVTHHGRPAAFTPWFGALAHAIFFRKGTLDYFHTHVCAPGASGCTSILGAAKVTGRSSRPGRLDVGVLVPVAGTWRLFLQCRVDGRVLTAPFTLTVR